MLTRRPRLVVAALLAVLTVVAFAPVVGNEFINFDDPMYVSANPVVQRGLTIANVRWALTATDAGNWHPLTWISHMSDWELFDSAAGGHHLVSLILHVANTVLLFLVLEAATGSLWPSALVAALFGVHPLHVESVAWIAERKDVLSTLFLLLGFRAYVAYVRRGGLTRYAAVAMSFALGIMTKPMVVTFPFVLLLLDYWPLARRDRRPVELLIEKLPLFPIAAIAAAATWMAQSGAGAVRSTAGLPLVPRLANAAITYVAYLRKMLWPADLAVFYPFPPTFETWRVVTAIAVLTAISAVAFRLAKQAPYLVVGWLWYLGMLVPVIGLVQVGHQSMADRYTYVPLVGIFVAIVFGARALGERLHVAPPVVATAALAVVALCVLGTRRQASQWRNSVTLFTHALAVTTDNYMAHEKLGEALVAEGRRAEGIDHFRETLRLTPTFAEAHVALADALVEEQDEPSAIIHYTEAIRLKPEDATANAKLGSALWRAGRIGDARDLFERVARLAPDDAQNLSNLGAVLHALGERDEALARFEAAVRLDPSNADAHSNFGMLLGQSGRRDEAERQLADALRLRPDFADAHYNLGNLLLADGRTADAAMHYEQALAAAPQHFQAHNNLGVALERLGRPADARAHFSEALRLRPDYAAAATNLARLDRGGG